MNELLQQLYRQAIESTNSDEHLDMPNKQLQRLILTKYAELIVRDCYSVIIKSQRGHFNPATSWDAVKQYFGVDE